MKRTIAAQTITINIEYLEFFSQPQHNRLTAYLVRGYEDARGDFHEMEREAINISGNDYEKLMAPNAQGKQKGFFRNDDVLAMADALKAQ
jgi:hypothetical protein